MGKIKSFNPANPTGETPGMEPINTEVLQAVVKNKQDATPPTGEMPAVTAPPPQKTMPDVPKTLHLPADLGYFRFNLTIPLPRPATQNHDLMGGRAGSGMEMQCNLLRKDSSGFYRLGLRQGASYQKT